MEKKNVLLITYYWPPSGGAGVQRWLKLSKYLAQDENLNLHVITVKPEQATYPVIDESFLKEVSENITIHRTETKEYYNLYKKVSKSKEVPFSGFANETKKKSPIKWLGKFVRANFFIPDPRKGWNKYVIRKVEELMNEIKFDTIVTTSPPHSTQLIGLELKKRFDFKWIADLRDPWTDIYYYDEFPFLKFAKKKDAQYEKRVLETADVKFVVSKAIKNSFLQKANIDEDSIKIVPNGFDEDDFMKPSKGEANAKTAIAYTGTMSSQYNPNSLVQALSEIGADKFSINFAGRISPDVRNQFSSIEFIDNGYVSHKESIDILQKADFLLLIIPDIEDNKGILTGKLFEYLAVRKPIICLGPTDGDAAEIIEKCNTGKTFEYSDVSGVQDYLENFSAENFKPNEVEIEKYSRKKIAAEILNLI